MWERRYGLLPADRAGTTRFYSTDQIRKLKLINELLNRGDAIGLIIGMSEAELRNRLAPDLSSGTQIDVDSKRQRELAQMAILFAGPGLSLFAREHAGADLKLIANVNFVESIEGIDATNAVVQEADVLVLEMPSLDVAVAKAIAGPLNLPTVIAYRNSHLHDREDAEESNLVAVRWPAGWREIETACLKAIEYGSSQIFLSKERTYSDRELVRIAIFAEQELDCDCVQNLIKTITDLNAYETHMSRCTEDLAHQATKSLVRDARAPLQAAVHSFIREHGLLKKAGLVALSQDT